MLEKTEGIVETKGNLRVFTVLFLVILATACGQKGIDTPINVNGFKLRITEAEFKDEIMVSNQRITAKSQSINTLLYIKSEVAASLEDLEGEEWNVELEDGSGTIYSPSVRGTTSTESEENLIMDWVFVVEKYQDSFTLRIDDTEIILDSFIPELSDEDKAKATAFAASKAISQVDILNCQGTQYLPLDKEVEIYNIHICDNKAQADKFIQAAQYDVTLDGEQVQFGDGESFESEMGDYLALFSKNIGYLEQGKHTIKTVLTFTEAVTSGATEYGPGTKYDAIYWTCNIAVN